MKIIERPPKYPSTPHWPESESVQRDDSYHSDVSVFIGQSVIITEKLDGGNTLLWNGDVYARSVMSPSHDGWMAMVRKHHSWKSLDFPNIAFYGEDMFGIHSIHYNEMKENETYRLFAVRDHDIFQSWKDVELYANILNIKTVPVLFKGTFNSIKEITAWFQKNINKPSKLGPIKEGFVMRIEENFNAIDFSMNVVKYVRANHVQTKKHWKENWKKTPLIK